MMLGVKQKERKKKEQQKYYFNLYNVYNIDISNFLAEFINNKQIYR